METTTYSKRTVRLVVFATVIGFFADGLDLMMLSISLQAIVADLNISQVLAGTISTWTLVGMGVGGIFAGWLSDRIGRIKVLIWALFLFSGCTVLLAFTNAYWQFALIRGISGFGLGAEFVVGSLYVSEFIPTEKRSATLAVLTAMWSVGYVVAGLLGATILPAFGWRPMFMVAVIPAIVATIVRRHLPESPTWAKLKAMGSEAKGKIIDTNEYAVILSDKKVRKTFISFSVANILYLFGYYGALTWLPSYIMKDFGVKTSATGVMMALTYFFMMAGTLTGGRLADKIGRKKAFIACTFAVAIMAPVMTNLATSANVAYLLLIWGFLYGMPTGIHGAFLTESYPTKIRGTAVGASFNLGRIGSFVSPILIGVLATYYSVGAGIAALGVGYGLSAIIAAIFIGEKMYDPAQLETAPAAPEDTAVVGAGEEEKTV